MPVRATAFRKTHFAEHTRTLEPNRAELDLVQMDRGCGLCRHLVFRLDEDRSTGRAIYPFEIELAIEDGGNIKNNSHAIKAKATRTRTHPIM